ncbi:hypothetical protein L210DRAFT_3558753, partial [Boletus edulis BED1]
MCTRYTYSLVFAADMYAMVFKKGILGLLGTGAGSQAFINEIVMAMLRGRRICEGNPGGSIAACRIAHRNVNSCFIVPYF